MAQINTAVGDFASNTKKILEAVAEANSLGADVITFPELAICGYPPEDLLLKPKFIGDNLQALNKIADVATGPTIIVGFVDAGEDIYNAAAIIHDNKIAGVYHKIYLPNYGVFDENRYFRAGDECQVYTINGVGLGVNICEDIWYAAGPATVQASAGAEVIVNISASPFHFGRSLDRERMLATRASDNICIVVYNNLVGGQDELIFDGNSMVLDEKGQLIARGKQFEEDLIIVDLDIEEVFRARLHDPRRRKENLLYEKHGSNIVKKIITGPLLPGSKPPLPQRQVAQHSLTEEVYGALVLGTRDYVHKNRFEKVVIGLSGGMDSSLVAVVAADALGPSNVNGVMLPSRYTSTSSTSDAELLAQNLGIKLMSVSIDGLYQNYLETLVPVFKETKPDVTEENIQARIRGNILMALSNKFGWLVLTTGNKSEMATGYTTLYGDMVGGFAVIKDVPKTMIYELARYRNSLAGYDLIPPGVLTKAPTAELRPGQKDTDTLPPYEVLDPILTAYVEDDKSVEQIISAGFGPEVVRRVAQLVDRSEYKRRQAPPGIKITQRAFGRDRRLPITNRYNNLNKA
jgi:NAD+ synthase (glutamine-hydrolysing)